MKKTALLILIAALLFTALLPACTNGKTPSGETESPSESVTAPPETEYPLGTPDRTFNGYGFRVLVSDPSTIVWYDVDFTYDDIANTLDNAVFQRISRVNDKLDIEITPVYANPVITELQKVIASGDDEFDICFAAPKAVSGMIRQGDFLNLNDIPYLDLNAPWWDHNAVDGLTVDDKLYIAAGDIGYNYLRSTSVIFFNKSIAADAQLADPYKMVEEGKWTFDNMFEMAVSCNRDLDGDGLDPDKDMMGIVYCGDTLYQMLIAGKCTFVTPTADRSSFELSFMSDRTYDVFDTLTYYLYGESANWDVTHVNASTQFTSGNLLFIPTEFWVITTFREMLPDFGVLPMPKYDDKQTEYHHTVNQDVAAMMLIPITNRDTERTGIIAETLAYTGKQLLRPAYIETSLISKWSRDNESEATIRLIFDSIYYDTGFMFDIGGIKGTIVQMASSASDALASTYESRQSVYEAELEKLLEDYDKLK